jgi:hypothetical protein
MLLCLRFGPDLTSKQEVVVPGLGNDEHNRQRFSIHDPDMAFEWPTNNDFAFSAPTATSVQWNILHQR